MADFCNQCAEEMGFGPGDLTGLCARDQMAQALCEGCGPVWVDADGYCLGNVDGVCGTDPAMDRDPGGEPTFHAMHGPLLPCGCRTSDPPCSLAHAVFTAHAPAG